MMKIFLDCREESPRETEATVYCDIRTIVNEGLSLVCFRDEPLDQIAFTKTLFADRGYWQIPSAPPGWSILAARDAADGAVAIRGNTMFVRHAHAWQHFVGNMAVQRVLRRQRDVIFFHAASVSLRGRGALIVGPKGSGKTTLSAVLAARGMTFLGDEITGVRPDVAKLVPLYRSISLREGFLSEGVQRRLERASVETITVGDGTVRRRAAASKLFALDTSLRPHLAYVVFLRRDSTGPKLVARRQTRDLASDLAPLGVSMWGVQPVGRVMQIYKLLSRVACYDVHVGGTPDDTANVIQKLWEG